MASTLWDRLPMLVGNDTELKDNSSCFSSTQSTVLKGVNFGGVPIVLLLDFIVFLVLLLIFTLIRRKLWDYGRLALVAETEGFSTAKNRRYSRMTSQMSTDEPEYERGCCSWLSFIFRMDETMIKERCGVDAIHYLSFQRHLIFLLCVICLLSVAIILPVNLSGELLGNNPYSFGRTTIANLQKGDNLLWLHTVFAVLYLILTVAVLKRHTSKMKGSKKENARNTLFVRSVPTEASNESIKTHFVEAYPSCQVTSVNLCYDVAKLIELARNRKHAEKNLQHYNKILERYGRREFINPRPCSHLCCCCHCQSCENVDAIDYYSSQEAALVEEINRLKENEQLSSLGMAFVSLQTEYMASYILKDFNALDCGGGAGGVVGEEMGGVITCGCGREPQPSSKSTELRVRRWKVRYAPHLYNIYWENLSIRGWKWWVRCLLLNSFLFIILLFLTTPSIIISTMDKFNVTKPIASLNNAIISQFFPTLLLWTFSSLLPTVVYYSTLWEAHWTRSSENMSMLYKLYTFLIFMVLILPSLGLSSLDVFLRSVFDPKGSLRLECVFLPDQGSFFVNYVIAAALVGSGMELLRLPGLLLYIVRLALANSAAERKYVKQHQAYEFQYGAVYGWMLCVFTVIMAYSITCPVIVPFGLLYLLLKHLVDKHNLYFAYLPACLDRKVHLGAVNQALAAPIICLFWLYFFSVLRQGFMAVTSLFTLVVLSLTIFICISYTCFGHFKYLSPHNYNVKEEDENATESSSSLVYLPKVLNPDSSSHAPERCSTHQSYGTTDINPSILSTEEDSPNLNT
ncbi:CSC1-like protein 1 [Paramisgurnus dabryanus]|uniref:CSC1-like protein 1 n=1 Tax=Paramisgurnus dabryanus TaxID=90735 RepID=UPI0031F41C60